MRLPIQTTHIDYPYRPPKEIITQWDYPMRVTQSDPNEIFLELEVLTFYISKTFCHRQSSWIAHPYPYFLFECFPCGVQIHEGRKNKN